ncbi:MAG: RIP metalloprotease RseP [Gemmatimonadetes bacterium]|nr:RIP metalloprotease RseP [Gemmatimonadota bacterium]
MTGLETVLVAVGAGIVVLGALIFVHEVGHFLAAKSMGIAVLRFSFGLGPQTPLGFRIGETHYCISWIPFGGFVKMAGLEDEGGAGALEGERQAAPVAPERTFDAKPLGARAFVISAGVAMNALFAVLLYAVLAGAYGMAEDPAVTVAEVRGSLPVGAGHLAMLRPGDRIVRINGDTMRSWGAIQNALLVARAPIRIEVAGRAEPLVVDVPKSERRSRLEVARALVAWREPVIGEVLARHPAAAAGLRSGDRILRAGEDTISSWDRFVRAVEQSASRALALTLEREGRQLTITVTPRATPVRDAASGVPDTVGRIGVAPLLPVRRFGVLGSVGQGFRQAASAGGLVLFALKGLIVGEFSPRDIGGPILIGQLSGEVARLGLEPFLSFLALFSMNLAVLNLLPIPVLDGGQLVFLLAEGIRGRPLSVEQRHRFTQVGFFLLVGIMLLALANDVIRLFPE